MKHQTPLLMEKEKGVWHLILNRPHVHNAFNDELIGHITKAFDKVKNDSSARAVVLSGKGKSFCAGADLNWMKETQSFTQEENYADSFGLSEMMEAMKRCPVPVVARVHGFVLGGGVGLVAACDYVLMSV